MITLELIKTIVEDRSQVDDLSINLRKRHLANGRFIYFYLAKKYTKKSLESIGSLVSRDHASVLHGIKKINYAFDTNDKEIIQLCLECQIVIKEYLEHHPSEGLDFDDVNELQQFYKIREADITKSFMKQIDCLKKDNELLKDKFKFISSSLHDEISHLNASELIELQDRIRIFIKVKSQLNKNKTHGITR